MTKKLSDIIKINTRFHRSVNISKDMGDAEILSGFICPASSEYALLNIAENVSTTGQAAFTWTGPYGSGKSTLALLLSALLGKNKKTKQIAEALLNKPILNKFKAKLNASSGWDVLPIVGDLKPPEKLLREALSKRGYRESGDLFEQLKAISRKNDGLLIIIDEMGKCLENASKGQSDVYFFQQLAEFCSRSNGKIIFIGILHQAFADYARYLPYTLRDEWIKIQGRYVDIPINTAGEEQIELIGLAINSDKRNYTVTALTKETVRTISKNRIITAKDKLEESLSSCWPLSPIAACLLVQLSRRKFGQNQRSIFSFLSSGEPRAFRDFINHTEYSKDIMYMPEDLFDYISLNLESSILASSDSKMWNVAVDVIARSQAKGGTSDHISLLKTIALIDIFKGTSGLVATNSLLQALYPNTNVKKILKDLADWSVVIYKKHLGAYSIYEGSDFDIEAALNEAYSSINMLDLSKLSEIANFKPIIAKRHYHKFGAMRWFDVLLSPVDNYENFLNEAFSNSKATGFFAVFLPQSPDELYKAKKILRQNLTLDFPVIMSVARNTEIIIGYLKEMIALEWIQKNKNDLVGDNIAKKEIEGRKMAAISLLEDQLNMIITSSSWCHDGERIGIVPHNKLSMRASDICDEMFFNSPRIRSELLNRTKPSSNANTALNSLLKDMVLKEGKEDLGLEGFTTERGIYNILLQETGIYARSNNQGEYVYKDPKSEDLEILWQRTDDLLKKKGSVLALHHLYDVWAQRPFGIKAGLYSFLALAYILTRRNKIAVYRDDIYVPQVDDLFVDYLIKNPKSISLKAVSSKDFSGHLLLDFINVLNNIGQNINLSPNATPLDVGKEVVSLVDRLPVWVLKTKTLTKQTTKFREAVKSANDPYKLLFEDLEKIFPSLDSSSNSEKSRRLAYNLRDSLNEMLDIYPATMKNIAILVTSELDITLPTPANLDKLRSRAKNIKGVSGDYRVDAFAARLSTFEASLEDIAGLVSLANNKPPQEWIDLDIENAKKELLRLSTEFKTSELYTKVKNRPSARHAIAFIAGIGGTSKIVKGEFNVLKDSRREIEELKDKVKKIATQYKKNKNVFLAALAEVSIEYLETK